LPLPPPFVPEAVSTPGTQCVTETYLNF